MEGIGLIAAEICDSIKTAYPLIDSKYDETRGIVTLCGKCPDWNTVVEIGHFAASLPGVYSVVNDLSVDGEMPFARDYSRVKAAGEEIGIIGECDVVIVGAGITGCGIARELSKYNLSIIVAECSDDVGAGATKANNGDIHSGYLEKPGTMKAKLNVRGNELYKIWAEELGFEIHRDGNIVVIDSEEFMPQLKASQANAMANGVESHMLNREETLKLEPSLLENGIDPVASLYMPSTAVVDPWQVAIALAENAAENGVKFMLNTMVGAVKHTGESIEAVVTDKGIIKTTYLINCAGVYADDISDMAGDKCFTIHPRRGTIAILDKAVKPFRRNLRMFDSAHPTTVRGHSKGGGMATTVSGNNLLGPSASEVPDKENLETTPEELAYAMSRNSLKSAGYKDIIRFFAGSRPATYTEDFFIEMSPKIHGLLNVAGIQSPGLASSPAIAEVAIGLLSEQCRKDGKDLILRKDFNPIRHRRIPFSKLTREEQDRLIREKPEYGHVVCRCETVTEGEIIEVLHSPIVPTSVDAIKRRVRAGMGRCQGGFCMSRVLEIISRELNIPPCQVELKGKGSRILYKENRQ